MTFQIAKHGRPGLPVKPEFTMVGDDKLIGSTSWRDPDGTEHEHFQVLTINGGKIVGMQGCATRRAAERFARRGR